MPFEKIAHPQKRAFLNAYATCGSVKHAAKAAGVSRESHYDWKRDDAEYEAEFALARQLAGDAIEDEAIRRAQLGVIEPVYRDGKRIGFRRRFSDRILLVLLKARRPEYADTRRIQHSGVGGEAIKVKLDLSSLSDKELDEFERLLLKGARSTPGAGEPARSGSPGEGAEAEAQD